jgi:hypothetical protein
MQGFFNPLEGMAELEACGLLAIFWRLRSAPAVCLCYSKTAVHTFASRHTQGLTMQRSPGWYRGCAGNQPAGATGE